MDQIIQQTEDINKSLADLVDEHHKIASPIVRAYKEFQRDKYLGLAVAASGIGAGMTIAVLLAEPGVAHAVFSVLETLFQSLIGNAKGEEPHTNAPLIPKEGI